MLLSGFKFSNGVHSDIDTIHNYYEGLVLEELQTALIDKPVDNEYIADVSCVALNSLPARYIRHDVDMMFYMSSDERTETQTKVTQAVKDAIAYVDKRSQNNT